MAVFSKLARPMEEMFDRVDVASPDAEITSALTRWRSARAARVYPAPGELPAPAPAEFQLERVDPAGRDWRLGPMGETARALLRPEGDGIGDLGARRIAVRVRRLAELAVSGGEPVVGSFREEADGRIQSFHILCAPTAVDHLHPDGVFAALDRSTLLVTRPPEAAAQASLDHVGPTAARDVMSAPVVSVAPDTPVPDVVDLLLSKNVSAVPVVKDGRIVGVVSEADLAPRAGEEPNRTIPWWQLLIRSDAELAARFVKLRGSTAADVMASDPVTAPPSATVDDLLRRMTRHGVRRVVIVDDGRPVGIVTRHDLLRAIAGPRPEAGPVDDETLRGQVLELLQNQPWFHLPDRDVIVVDGVVCIWGSVDSPEQREALRAAAASVPGVRRVQVETQVSPRFPAP
jgi:CBS domain-containing protein